MDNNEITQLPPQSRKRCINMRTATDITREMNKLYSEARRGKLPTADLSRYGNFLNIMMGCLRESELEAEIRSLRESMEAQGIPIKSARPQLVKTAA